VWIGGLGLLGGVVSAIMFPAWQAMLPELVPREDLLNGIALNSAQFQSARLLGPLAAAALVLVGAGMGEIFFVNAASFLFVIAALWAIRPHPAADTQARGPRGGARDGAWTTLTAGLRYAVDHPNVGILILSTAVMTIFGLPYMMLLPAYADKVIGGGAAETAWLMAANGLGAVFGSLVVAGLPKDTRRERLIPFGLLVFAALLFAFSLSRTLVLSLVISALAGAAVLTVNSLANTSIQSSAPPQLRGRVMALFIMSFMGLMPISSLVFGPIAKAVGPAYAIMGGSVVLGAWALVLVAKRSLLEPQGEAGIL
jgi:MFS family permease